MADQRYRYIDVETGSDDDELIVISASTVNSPPNQASLDSDHAFLQGQDSCQEKVDASKADVRTEPASAKSDKGPAASEGLLETSTPEPDDQDDLNPQVPFANMQKIVLALLALLVIVFAIYFLTGCSGSGDKQQNVERATNKVILQYNVSTNKSKSVSTKAYDVTGDGELDQIKLKPVLKKDWQGKKYLSEIAVTVNKKKALSFTAANHSYLKKVSDVSLKLMELSDGSQFVYLYARDHDQEGFSGVYKYKKGTLKPVITSYANSEAVWSPIAQMKNYNMSAQAVEDGVQVTVDFTCYATGLTKATFDFTSRDGSLALEHDEAVSFSYRSLNAHSYDTAALTAQRSFTVYRERDLQSFPFEVSPGETCTIESIALDGDRLLFKIKVDDNEGWIANPSYGSQTLFEETSTTDDFDEEASDA